MAKRKRKQPTDPEKLLRKVEMYEQVFDEVEHFIELINRQDQSVVDAQQVTNAAKAKYEQARDELAACREARDGTKHALFMFLRPGPAEIETLFQSREIAEANVGREMASAMGVFWQYLDRWESPTLFVLATNMPERLDAALRSRIDVAMEFGPPTREQASNVVAYWSEVLHEYGGGEWRPLVDDGRQWESFRALFHEVQVHVRRFVTRSES